MSFQTDFGLDQIYFNWCNDLDQWLIHYVCLCRLLLPKQCESKKIENKDLNNAVNIAEIIQLLKVYEK